MRFVSFCCFCILLIFVTTAQAENWAQWRGSKFNGISNDTNLPIEWSQDKNIAWRFPLPGPSGATPVVWEDRIFVSTVDGEDLLLICVSTDGKELWRKLVGRGNQTARGDEGNSSSPSPATDGEHVWIMMGTGDLACYTVDGEDVWHFNLQDRFGAFDIQFGMSSTPVYHDGKLLLQLIHGDGNAKTEEAVVAALDAKTGKTLWESERVTGAYAENEHSYASAVLYDFDGLTQLITHGGDFTIAYDPETGEELWRLGGLNPQDDPDKAYHRTLRLVSSPCPAPGIVISPTAKRGPVFAVRPDQSGDVTGDEKAIRWVYPEYTPDVSSPLVQDGLVYLCRENGNLLCLDLKSGEEVYHERTNPQRHRASPLYADGYVYLAARDGRVTVVKAGRDFEIVARNELGEAIASSLAVSNGTIYIRTFDALYAVKK
ncbi:outer membrane protein assembly factor BamB family protein [Calycomorphotria hydatis]|nr:PQQ-binding-like beta-propeller repeat protein [Calycomorphotria hydatis]